LTSFLEGKLAAALAKGFNGKLMPVILRKVVTSGRDAHGDPITTTQDFAGQGFPDSYSAIVMAAAGIPATDSKIILIAGLTAAEPAVGDKVLVRLNWFQIRNVVVDPARATFECQCFKVDQ
jgi:hypothetical protein